MAGDHLLQRRRLAFSPRAVERFLAELITRGGHGALVVLALDGRHRHTGAAAPFRGSATQPGRFAGLAKGSMHLGQPLYAVDGAGVGADRAV